MAKLSLILLAAPIALTSFSVPALADEPVRIVRYHDLDLANAEHRDQLKARVRVAVRQVCRSNQRPTIEAVRAEQQCTRHATRDSDTKLASLFDNHGAQYADRASMVVAAH